jgi:hypothetical protein
MGHRFRKEQLQVYLNALRGGGARENRERQTAKTGVGHLSVLRLQRSRWLHSQERCLIPVLTRDRLPDAFYFFSHCRLENLPQHTRRKLLLPNRETGLSRNVATDGQLKHGRMSSS